MDREWKTVRERGRVKRRNGYERGKGVWTVREGKTDGKGGKGEGDKGGGGKD